MPFLREPEPPRGIATEIAPGVRRIVARNGGVMTYWGTNTYLLEGEDGLTVLDPGPADDQHVADVLAAAGDTPIAALVLTHRHSDHSGAVAPLRAATGAVFYAGSVGTRGLAPDVGLRDGEAVLGLRAVFTPGHARDHLSFAYTDAGGRKILFSGDHVMSWSSSIVNPPDGDMRAYYHALELLLHRDDAAYLPGHGPLLPAPRDLVAELLAHRQRREAAILTKLRLQGWSVAALAETLYAKMNTALKLASQRNVLAHCLKLQEEGVVTELAPEAAGPDPSDLDIEEKYRVDGLRRFALLPII